MCFALEIGTIHLWKVTQSDPSQDTHSQSFLRQMAAKPPSPASTSSSERSTRSDEDGFLSAEDVGSWAGESRGSPGFHDALEATDRTPESANSLHLKEASTPLWIQDLPGDSSQRQRLASGLTLGLSVAQVNVNFFHRKPPKQYHSPMLVFQAPSPSTEV